MAIRALVWGENVHEPKNAEVREIYPDGMHNVDRRGAARRSGHRGRDRDPAGARARPDRRRGSRTTDVLLWWGHTAHGDVADAVVERVANRVWEGMGLIVLHSGPFLEDLQAPDGDALQPEMARGGRARAALGDQPQPPDRRRASASASRCRSTRDVRRAVHRAGADGDGVHLLVRGRRGVPLRPDLAARRREASSISRPATRPIRSITRPRSSRCCATPCAGRTIRRRAGSGIADAPNVPVDKAPEKIESRGPRLHADGEAGFR